LFAIFIYAALYDVVLNVRGAKLSLILYRLKIYFNQM